MKYLEYTAVLPLLMDGHTWELEEYHSIDITRCQDCKFYRAPSWCSHFNRIMTNTAYCSDGEEEKKK